MNHTTTISSQISCLGLYCFYCWYIFIYIYLHFMCLYYSCYHLPRRMGLFWSGALSEDSKLMHRMLLVYQSSYRHLNQYVEPLSPLSRFATNIFMDTTQILSLTVSFERTQTKTNNCTTIYLPTLAIHFVCPRFPFSIHPTFLHYILFRTSIVNRFRSTDPIR